MQTLKADNHSKLQNACKIYCIKGQWHEDHLKLTLKIISPLLN